MNGRQPSKNEVAILIRETRAEKLTEISDAEVKARQLSRLSAEEAHTLKELRQTRRRSRIDARISLGCTFSSLRAEHIFERVSVAKDHELKTQALRHGRGRMELPEVKAALMAEIASGAMLAARGEVATKESLQRERRMVSAIDQGIRNLSRWAVAVNS